MCPDPFIHGAGDCVPRLCLVCVFPRWQFNVNVNAITSSMSLSAPPTACLYGSGVCAFVRLAERSNYRVSVLLSAVEI